MYYDPMIAKLCTWGKDRASAIDAMEQALDKFELEGIGHNLPFLSAVMGHVRFRSGNITTAFIEEEYPDGFVGVDHPPADIQKIAAVAAVLNMISKLRGTRISGVLANRKHKIGKKWVVQIGGEQYPVKLKTRNEGAEVKFADGSKLDTQTNWRPGQSLVRAIVDGQAMAIKISPMDAGFQMRYRGADIKVSVFTQRAAELASLMPEKTPPDTSNLLLCPMPGLVVSVAVNEGDEVQEGQSLATVEAMKMENILRAEKKAIVKKINAKAGDSLAVDDVIMEFE